MIMVSCTHPSDELTESDSYFIKSSVDGIQVLQQGIIKEVEIESNVSWIATSDNDWIELMPDFGDAGITLYPSLLVSTITA